MRVSRVLQTSDTGQTRSRRGVFLDMNEKMTGRDRTRKAVVDSVSVSGSSKVAKLIRLAADPAAFPNERAVALRKANELTEPASLRVTEKSADTVPAPEPASRICRETGHDQLGLRVTAAGARSWTLDYVCNGRQRRFTV